MEGRLKSGKHISRTPSHQKPFFPFYEFQVQGSAHNHTTRSHQGIAIGSTVSRSLFALSYMHYTACHRPNVRMEIQRSSYLQTRRRRISWYYDLPPDPPALFLRRKFCADLRGETVLILSPKSSGIFSTARFSPAGLPQPYLL